MKTRSQSAFARQLEAEARRQPEAFVRKVRKLAWVGYAYLWMIIVLLFGLCIILALTSIRDGREWLMLPGVLAGWTAMVPFWYLLRAGEKPQGCELMPGEFPTLFADLGDLSRQLGSEPLHHVWLTDELNAGAAKIRSIGGLGPPRNQLVLGLPLLSVISREEMRAILAHELAHLTRHDSPFLLEMGRLREALIGLAESEVWLYRLLFRSFASWFGPNFDAHVFTAIREQEFGADRIALNVVGQKEMLTGKIRTHLVSRTNYEDFSSELFSESKLGMEMPKQPVTRLLEAIQQPVSPQRQSRVLRAMLSEETSPSDSHPSLSDSLGATGRPVSEDLHQEVEALTELLHPMEEPSAASFYLEDRFPELVDQLNLLWRSQHGEIWERSRRSGKSQQRELEQLEQRFQKEAELTVGELWRRAELTLELYGEETAMPTVLEVLAQDPNHAAALFTMGYWKLRENGDPEGAALLQRALEADSSYEEPGRQILAQFARENRDLKPSKRP